MDKDVNKSKRKYTDDVNKDENDTKKRKQATNRDDTTNIGQKQDVKPATGAEPEPACASQSHESPGSEKQPKLKWREIRDENLNCDYCILYNRQEADEILRQCEAVLTYNEGMLAKVKVFGKWHDMPRQQVAYGDPGLSYSFSNTTVPARPWIPMLQRLRDNITMVTGYTFNFVLINRYRNGNDYIGEHRDDEKDLTAGHPIASLTLGQKRDFVFKHADARGKNAKRKKDTVKIELEHGGLLMMKYPTNKFWYHSLPPRKKAGNVRINMTFRKMVENTSTK